MSSTQTGGQHPSLWVLWLLARFSDGTTRANRAPISTYSYHQSCDTVGALHENGQGASSARRDQLTVLEDFFACYPSIQTALWSFEINLGWRLVFRAGALQRFSCCYYLDVVICVQHSTLRGPPLLQRSKVVFNQDDYCLRSTPVADTRRAK